MREPAIHIYVPVRRGLLLGAICAAVLLIAVAAPGFARTGRVPAAFTAPVAPLSSVDTADMPYVDEARYLREDAERDATGIDAPLRFAAAIPTQLQPSSDGTWELLAGGSRVWRIRVVSTGARTLNFGIGALRLPPGAGLYFYSAGSHAYDGPYTSADVAPDGELWTAVIPGDQAVIEMDVPSHTEFEPSFVITQVGHDYRGFGKIVEREGSCNIDVICPQGDPWRNEIRAGGVFQLSGQWTCSGQMINSNVTGAPPPYFLTANHCGISAGNASSFVVYWNYDAPICGEHCCGRLTNHQTGATLLAKYSPSDFCLIQLLQAPADSANIYLSGWDASLTNAPSSAVAIHHPNCDVKAISFCNTPLTVTSYGGYSVPGDGTHWHVDHYDVGTTEPGSSGGGLYDPNHHLVGELHGGPASCSSITSDWYGRIPVSWTGGGTSGTSLKNWLDPNGTGTLVLDGRNPTNPAAVNDPGAAGSGIGLFSLEPNPVRAGFQVHFSLSRQAQVSVALYDASGRITASRPAQSFGAGSGVVSMDGRGGTGASLAPGIYFVRLIVDGKAAGSQKLVVVQ